MMKKTGFSMIELTSAIAIIGILIAVAMPFFYKWKIKSMQTQAVTNLSTIFRLQQIYFSDNERYMGSMTEVFANGFELSERDLYNYTVESTNANGTSFLSTATSKKRLASCSKLPQDIWTIDELKTLVNLQNGGDGCL